MIKVSRIQAVKCFITHALSLTVVLGLILNLMLKDLVYARIDRRRKLLATIILRAIGMDTAQILDQFLKKLKYLKVMNPLKLNWLLIV